MVDSPSSIGSGTSPLSSPSVDGRSSRSGGASPRAASRDVNAFGRRGTRVLSPDISVDQLDRSAPRGTYLDILV